MKKYPFQVLGFAYLIVGLLMSYPFFNGVSSAGLTLTIAGLILLVTVEIEGRKEDRQTS